MTTLRGTALLGRLLHVWRRAPHRALADRIEQLSAHGGASVRRSEWLQVAAQRDPTTLGVLLATALDARGEVLRTRLDALAAFDADPRLDRFVAQLYAQPPLTSSGARSFWAHVLPLALRVRDAVAIGALRHTHAVAGDDDWGRFLRAQLDRVLLTASDEEFEPDAEALAMLAVEAVDPREQDEDALLLAVLERPDDVSLRAVLRDALLERGDPRGRLMALQAGVPDEKKVAAFIKQHRDALLGPLAPLLKHAVFRDGFLVDATLKQSSTHGHSLARVASAGHPLWATVERLVGPGDAEITMHPVMRSLRTLEHSELSVKVMRALSVTRLLSYRLSQADALALGADLSLLPALRELHVVVSPTDVPLLLRRAEQLDAFHVDLPTTLPREVPHLVSAIADLGVRQSSLGFLWSSRAEPSLRCSFSRDDTGLVAEVSLDREGVVWTQVQRLVDDAQWLAQLARDAGALVTGP